MRMSNLLDHRLLAQSHYRNSISPSSAYSEDEDRASENSGSANLSTSHSAVNNLLNSTNHSSNSGTGNPFPFTMNGTNSQSDLQSTLPFQHAATAAAAQLVRKLQQQHNQLNNSSNNNSALAAAAAQLSQSNAFSNYSAFYSAAAAALNNGADLPLLANALSSNGGQSNSASNGTSPQSSYIATNQYAEIPYKGQQVAAFLAANKNPTEYLLCLPQVFELFLKHLVGGLHTVYTKLKRLDITPIVCNVEQVRILRGRGAIQPGVNRCKLLATKDFDILYKDCTTARSGRPARPNEDAGLLPNCGSELGDCDASCDDERQSRRVLARLGNRLHMPDSILKRHKPDLENNMLPLLFANEDSGQGGAESSHRSSPNGQLLSPAAALRFAVRNSPGIGSLHGFNGSSNNLVNSTSSANSSTTTNTNSSNQTSSNQNSSSNPPNNGQMLGNDFNTTAAYLWSMVLQQQQNNNGSNNSGSNRNSSSSNGGGGGGGGLLNGDLISPSNNGNNHNNSTTNGSSALNNSALALNLSRSLSNLASSAGASSGAGANQASSNELLNNSKANNHQLDESTDEDDELNDDEMDDSELRSSHSNSNSIDNHPAGNLFNGFKESRTETPTVDQLNSNQMNNILGPALLSNNNKENAGAGAKDPSNKEQLPFGQLGLSNLINNDDLFRGLNRSNSADLKNGSGALALSQNISSIGNSLSTNTDSLESLLRNIENLVSIAVHNARQQQQQLNLHKAELRAEFLSEAEKEKNFREQLEKQLNEEQRQKLMYQKKLRRERIRRKRIEQDLQQVQNRIQSDRNSPLLTSSEKATSSNGRAGSPAKQQANKTPTGNGLDTGANSPTSYGSPASTNENLKENSHSEKDCEMAVD